MSASILTVIVYDVADDRRRTKLHALLKQYGVAVQESAFEGRLTPAERTRLLDRVEQILDTKADRFVLYTVPKDHEERIAVVGLARPAIPDPGYFLV